MKIDIKNSMLKYDMIRKILVKKMKKRMNGPKGNWEAQTNNWLLYPKICPPIFLKTFQEKFTSPTRRVIFRCYFAKISLITYSQIKFRLKSQFFKEGIRMCEFSRINMVKKCAESAVFTH